MLLRRYKGKAAESGVGEDGEVFVDAGVDDIGEGVFIHVGADVGFAVGVEADALCVVEKVFRDARIAEVRGVAEPGAEGLPEGAEDAGGGGGSNDGYATAGNVLNAIDGEFRIDAE